MRILISLSGVQRDRAVQLLVDRICYKFGKQLAKLGKVSSEKLLQILINDAAISPVKREAARISLDQIEYQDLDLPKKYVYFLGRTSVRIVLVGYETGKEPNFGGVYTGAGFHKFIHITISEAFINSREVWTKEDLTKLPLHYTSIITHELTHAVDDYMSKGKYAHNKRSAANRVSANQKIFTKEYWNDPLEINARYAQAISLMSTYSLSTPDRYFELFKEAFIGWEDLPNKDKVRLRKKAFADYIDRNSRLNNQEERIIQRFSTNLRASGAPFNLTYYSDLRHLYISPEWIDNKYQADNVFPYLPKLSKFADSRSLILAIDINKRFSDNINTLRRHLKKAGFVPNRGATKNEALIANWWRPLTNKL